MNIYRVIMVEERSVTYLVEAKSINEAKKKIYAGEAEEVSTDTLDFDIVDYSVEERRKI